MPSVDNRYPVPLYRVLLVVIHILCTVTADAIPVRIQRRVSILALIQISAGRSGPPNQDRVWADCGNARAS